MRALILAAGYGTRLYPLTIGMPKALLEIGKKRLIDFLIEKVHEAKIDDITVVTNDRFYYDFLEWSRKYPFTINILNDQTKDPEERLGAVGDVEFQHKCVDVFERFSQEGRTIIFVTHGLESVQRFCNKAVLLESGQIVARGNPHEVIETYKAHAV